MTQKILAGLAIAASLSGPAFAQMEKPSLKGDFLVSALSRLDPPLINRLHGWTVTLRDREGHAINDASIAIDGAVPGLDRHMPTAPRVTSAPGGGVYEIGGVKFDMAGRWRLRLDIAAGEVKDAVEFDILVQ
jgi:hypothetical protein